MCLNVLVLLIQELQIRVDEIKVIFGSDVVVATKSLQKLLTVDSYTQVHQNNVTNNVLPLGFWYQCVLQEMNTNKNLVHRLLAFIVQSFHKFSSKTVTLYSMICFIKLLYVLSSSLLLLSLMLTHLHRQINPIHLHVKSHAYRDAIFFFFIPNHLICMDFCSVSNTQCLHQGR